jgi:hypothetical protein
MRTINLTFVLAFLMGAPSLKALDSIENPGINRDVQAIQERQQATKSKFRRRELNQAGSTDSSVLPLKTRKLYRAYLEAPTHGNAKKLASSIPVSFDDQCLVMAYSKDFTGDIDVKETLTRYFFNVAGEGLDALERLNPELVARIHNKIAGIPVKIACDNEAETAHLHLYFWSQHSINLQDAERSLRMFQYVKKFAGEQWAFFEKENQKEQTSKNLLFHEFLHHADLNMVAHSEREHNTLRPKSEVVNKRQIDQVYSCSALAFPSKEMCVARETGRLYSMTAQACRTCLQYSPAHCNEFPEGPSPSIKVPTIDYSTFLRLLEKP